MALNSATDGTGSEISRREDSVHAQSGSREFIPSSVWAGPREGYYFGTTERRGTGYYLDRHAGNPSKSLQGQDTADDLPSPAKRPKRSVQIAEDRNTVELIPSRVTTTATTASSSELELLEQAERQAVGRKVIELTVAGVHKAASQLRTALERNTLLRAQYSNQPERYMESEIGLYEHIVPLKSLAAFPAPLYSAILQSPNDAEPSLWSVLCELLAHDNDDIGVSVVSLLVEWLDPTLIDQDVTNLRAVASLGMAIWRDCVVLLVEKLSGHDGLAGATTESSRPDSDGDEVGKGSDDILTLLENLLELDVLAQSSPSEVKLTGSDVSVAARLCATTRLLPWLVEQLDSSSFTSASKYKERALELLTLIAPREDVHSMVPDWSRIPLRGSDSEESKPASNGTDGNIVPNSPNSDTSSRPTIDAIELLLQIVATFRKSQPPDEARLSLLENASIVLAAALSFSAHNVEAFIRAQGIELVLRCLRERVHAGGLALKWLDFAGVGTEGDDAVYRGACEHLVHAGALKFLCPLLMGRHGPRQAPIVGTNKRAKKEWVQSLESTTIRIFYALTRHLRDESPHDAKQRFLAKLVDDATCDRLVELCLHYDAKARQAEFKFYQTDAEETLGSEDVVELAALDAKLAGGGDLLYRVCAVAAFGCVGSKRCHERILEQLRLQQSGVALLRDVLREFASHVGPGKQREQLDYYLQRI